MSARSGGGAHWNDETQSWEQDEPPPRRGAGAAPRPPDRPAGPPPSPPMFGPPPEPPYVAPPWLSPASGPPPGAYHDAETQGAYELPRDPAHPPPYAPPVDPGRRRQRAIVAAVATAVLAGGLAGGWLMWGRDDGSGGTARASSSASVPGSDSGTPTDSATDTATDTPTGTPSETPTETPTDSGSPDTSTAAVPDGFRRVEDPLGWSVAVPATWTRTEERSSALYRSPDQRYLLQMFRLTEPGITPYEALRITSHNLAFNRGYDEISLRRMTEVTTTDAAELVYAYNRTVQTDRIQGIARSFVAANGVPYTVLVYGPDEDWPAQLGVLNKVLGTFTPN